MRVRSGSCSLRRRGREYTAYASHYDIFAFNKSVFAEGQGLFVTSHLGEKMASVTWATEVSTKWVDQIDQLTDIFEEVSIFVEWLGRFALFAK